MAAVPDDAHRELLTDESEVQFKVVPALQRETVVGEKQLRRDPLDNAEQLVRFEGRQPSKEFVGLTKEELKSYINDPRWKRIRWAIALLYIASLALLLIGSILLIWKSPRCPPKTNLVWYEQEIIYELDLRSFRDSNADGIGDIQGFMKKLPYLERNGFKSVLFQSSIFHTTSTNKANFSPSDLYTLDSSLGTDMDLENITKILHRKDMHLIMDLPISSTADSSGRSWYGSSQPLGKPIQDPCYSDQSSLGCRYFKLYGRFPLDFHETDVLDAAETLLRHWLLTKKFDGVRVDLPLDFNRSSNVFTISYETIDRWNNIRSDIEKKSKPKLLLFDIPSGLDDAALNAHIHNERSYPLLISADRQQDRLTAEQIYERIGSFRKKNLLPPHFWKLGSSRKTEMALPIDARHLSPEMTMTLVMLLGGTPIVLYGQELGLDQMSNPLMSWTSERPYGGFSECSVGPCVQRLLPLTRNPAKTNVKREEAIGGSRKESLLTLTRRLSKLRQSNSFQYGRLTKGAALSMNLFWFIREAPGHRGFLVLFNLADENTESAHVSLPQLTSGAVPGHVHWEYQWPHGYFPHSNHSTVNSDNLLVEHQSINIFSWKEKLIKPAFFSSKNKESLLDAL